MCSSIQCKVHQVLFYYAYVNFNVISQMTSLFFVLKNRSSRTIKSTAAVHTRFNYLYVFTYVFYQVCFDRYLLRKANSISFEGYSGHPGLQYSFCFCKGRMNKSKCVHGTAQNNLLMLLCSCRQGISDEYECTLDLHFHKKLFANIFRNLNCLCQLRTSWLFEIK